MDPTTAVRTDTLPAIATLVVPGVFATSGYLWLGLSQAPADVRTFLGAHEAIATIGTVLIWVGAGFAVESLASYAEVYLIDRRRADHAEMQEIWWRYLTIVWTHEPIGQRYIRRFLVSFKFELNTAVAAVVAVPAPLLLGAYGHIVWRNAFLSFMGLVLLALLFFAAAKNSAGVLAETRKRLVAGLCERVVSRER
jgi:hypothetical protein